MKKTIALLLLIITPYALADKAYFAGGCFWCVEAAYQDMAGVRKAVSGFTGGEMLNPTYNGDHRGHFEAVAVTYDPDIISYADLLDIFWHNIDPFDNRGQFCDKGPSYRSAIFPVDEAQRALAEASLAAVQAQFPDQTIYTEIRDAGRFWPVEEYHQDYYKKNPIRYRFYKSGCRRDDRLEQIWGDKAGGH
ncbi:MAG: peptide-methionine (S)-S-oxide reductase MsrA [Proteobacteria bacterium]|jgi:peptide-methionine (S)-S-oxide reductase|nr:peptide-methionine (S)-S-oxide reductase MsrA [Pseudomonadota bacterium]MDA1300689.1 peptide-methionine (S)-S-oxide reductase MsrA [Pseudomonadota bacterium]